MTKLRCKSDWNESDVLFHVNRSDKSLSIKQTAFECDPEETLQEISEMQAKQLKDFLNKYY